MLVDGMIIRRGPLQPQGTWPADANRPLRQQAVLHRFAGVATTVPPQRCQTREGSAKAMLLGRIFESQLASTALWMIDHCAPEPMHL